MSVTERVNRWKVIIVELGVFLVFLVLFGKFVWSEIGPVIGPLFNR
jgi:hypothetical protein